jgi:hypothetical protein
VQRKKFLSTLVTILTLLCQGSGRGVAEVRLSGTQDRAVLETNNAPIGEIVTALRTAFGIEVTADAVDGLAHHLHFTMERLDPSGHTSLAIQCARRA